MKLRSRLTIHNTTIIGVVYLACLLLVYLIAEHNRSQAFFRDLHGEAITKAHLFLQNQVDAETMQSIYLNNMQFIDEVEVAVYSTDFVMLYHDAMEHDIIKETREMIDNIVREGEIEFYVGDYQAIGIVYPMHGTDYIVTAAARDGCGYNMVSEIRRMLVLLFFVGLLLVSALGYFLAYTSLRPIRDTVSEVEEITEQRFDRRLVVHNPNDELGELSIAFNDLLDRLQISFEQQKMFVSNVSHELRTPLAALTAGLDISLQKERTTDEYQRAIGEALLDAGRMTRLIDGLLNLAKASYHREMIKMEEIRLDELLLDAMATIQKAHPDYRVELLFEQEDGEDDRLITVMGNVYLLTIAFSNLIENNCKYSEDHTSFIQISYYGSRTIVRLSDTGMGMSDIDRENLFTLFYRGEKEKGVDGHGIGMALAERIIKLHQGVITVHSEEGRGTTFVVETSNLLSDEGM